MRTTSKHQHWHWHLYRPTRLRRRPIEWLQKKWLGLPCWCSKDLPLEIWPWCCHWLQLMTMMQELVLVLVLFEQLADSDFYYCPYYCCYGCCPDPAVHIPDPDLDLGPHPGRGLCLYRQTWTRTPSRYQSAPQRVYVCLSIDRLSLSLRLRAVPLSQQSWLKYPR
jgi:hypothetical protein